MCMLAGVMTNCFSMVKVPAESAVLFACIQVGSPALALGTMVTRTCAAPSIPTIAGMVSVAWRLTDAPALNTPS